MALEGKNRRKSIMDLLLKKTMPISGSELAETFHVSRQVIVQDIALLRAENQNIMSTNKGYVLFPLSAENQHPKALIHVSHTAEQTLEEMYTIVDLGGSMLDVFVDHDLYGQIRADLIIKTRQDADEFVEKLKYSKSKPLKALTGEYHYHTICAPSEKVLSLIQAELKEKGFLCI